MESRAWQLCKATIMWLVALCLLRYGTANIGFYYGYLPIIDDVNHFFGSLIQILVTTIQRSMGL